MQIPFASAGLDRLFRMKRGPQPLAAVRESLDLKGADDLFPSLFTTRPPRKYEAYRGDGVRWRYFGHACILNETSGVSILIDLVLSYTYESEALSSALSGGLKSFRCSDEECRIRRRGHASLAGESWKVWSSLHGHESESRIQPRRS